VRDKGSVADCIKVHEFITDDDTPKCQYSLCYGLYCLIVIMACQVVLLWAKNAMASFYGYGIAGKIDDPFYAMQKADLGLNA
jgi:hypothetical protein